MKNLLLMTLVAITILTGCAEPKKRESASRGNVESSKSEKNKTSAKKEGKGDKAKAAKTKPISEMTPVEVAQFHFDASVKGDVKGVSDTIHHPQDEKLKELFRIPSSEQLKDAFQGKTIKVLDGKIFGDLAITDKCEFDSAGKLLDIDPLFLLRENGTWKIVMSPNAMAVKNELKTDELRKAFSQAVQWRQKYDSDIRDKANKLMK